MIPVPNNTEFVDVLIDSLDTVRNTFGDILDTVSYKAISRAQSKIISSKQTYEANKNRTDDPNLVVHPWGFQIDFDAPIRFIETIHKGHDLVADIVCRYEWKESAIPVNQELVIRVWNKSLSYREDLDHENFLDLYSDPNGKGRVMFRCHFDLANEGQDGPKYHLQFGGNARDEENCWIPEEIKIPRIAFQPMDIILACQMVVANFFSSDYQQKYSRDFRWKNAVTEVQSVFLRDYYARCVDMIDNEQILLDDLWN